MTLYEDAVERIAAQEVDNRFIGYYVAAIVIAALTATIGTHKIRKSTTEERCLKSN